MSQAMVPVHALGPRPMSRMASQLSHVKDVWKNDRRGAAYISGLDGWIASMRSHNTVKAYVYSLMEFVDWYEKRRRVVPAPHVVTRAEASEYATWLATRSIGMDEERLVKAGRQLDVAIWRALLQRPGLHIDDIRSAIVGKSGVETVRQNGSTVLAMEKDDSWAFDKYLACLCGRRLLRRTPTIAELRKTDRHAALNERADPHVFSYFVETRSVPTGERASTLVARLSALSSFWSYLCRTGENIEGFEAPIKSNIWAEPLRSYQGSARAQKRLARQRTQTDRTTFDTILATTDGRTLADLRDRAALMFFYWTGARASEVGSIRRGNVTWSDDPSRPPIARVLGKGKKLREFVIPPDAYRALIEMSNKLVDLSQEEEGRARTEGYISRARLLLAPEAPLFPALSQWGCNSPFRGMDIGERTPGPDVSSLYKSLTRSAFSSMLRRRAVDSGADLKRAHPHGLRHLAGRDAVRRGVPLPIIKEVFGHSSSAVTDAYTEEYDPGRLSLAIAAPAPERMAVEMPYYQPPPSTVQQKQPTPPRRPPPTVIDTTAVPSPETPAEERLVSIGAPEGQPKTAGSPLWAYADPDREKRQKIHDRKVDADDVLAETYVGELSRMVWWYGPTGKLKPQMPVMSPNQAAGDDDTARLVRKALGALYMDWMWSDDPGPTGAQALIAWLNDGLEVTEQVDDFALTQGMQWMPFDASVGDVGTHGSYEEQDLREQLGSKVVDWFAGAASRHLMTAARPGEPQQRVIDDPRMLADRIPDWYKTDDPIRSLLPSEREELFTWLAALTGVSKTSEPDETAVEQLLVALESYSDMDDQPPSAQKDRYLRDVAVQIERDVSRMTGSAVPHFDIGAAEKERRRKSPGMRRERYWRGAIDKLMAQAAGSAAGAKEAAGAAPAILDDDEYRELFRFDPRTGTITHSPEYRQRFLEETGAHSECVARRIARHLWELKRAGTGFLSRRAILTADIGAMKYFLVPCAHDLEKELRERRGSPKDPKDIEAALARHASILRTQQEIRAASKATGKERMGMEARGEVRRAEREHVARPTARTETEMFKKNFKGSVSHLVPNPVLLILSGYSMRSPRRHR